VALAITRTLDPMWRGGRRPASRAWRRALGSSLLTGTLAVGGGAVLAPGPGIPAAPAGASVRATSTCAPVETPTAAQNASTTGITPTSVTVGNVSIITGPVPGLFAGAPIGVKAYFDMINSQGGVNGRKLYVDSKDDAFSGSQNQTETEQAIASDFALVGSFSLFDGYGCAALAQNSAVPDVSVTLDSGTNALPNDFSAQPLAFGESNGPIAYYKKHYPNAKTLGAIVSDVASAKAQWEGQLAGFVAQGYKLGYVDYVNPLQSDFTTDVINMKSHGVTAVDLTDVDWQDGAIFVQDMATQSWHPALVFSGGPLYAAQFISHAGGPAATSGIQIGQGQALYLGQDAKSVPADQQFLTYVKKVNASWMPDLYTLYGWASAQLFVQALRAAGAHPTRGAVIAQLKKITSFGASGLLGTANPAAKTPTACYLMAQIKNGKYVRETPPTSGFNCNTTYYQPSGS